MIKPLQEDFREFYTQQLLAEYSSSADSARGSCSYNLAIQSFGS